MTEKYTIHDVIKRGYNLEPLTCLYCNSQEVTYNAMLHDALCESCGLWQLDGESNPYSAREEDRSEFEFHLDAIIKGLLPDFQDGLLKDFICLVEKYGAICAISLTSEDQED